MKKPLDYTFFSSISNGNKQQTYQSHYQSSMIYTPLLFLLVATRQFLAVDRIHSQLTDEFNRIIIIHGLNYEPTLPLELLSQQGFSSIRITLSAEKLQPKNWNYSYLAELQSIVKKADKLDISVTLSLNYKGSPANADQIGDTWVKIAGYFQGDPNVIGFDLLDQSSSGVLSWRSLETCLDARSATNKVLLPLYKVVAKRIREVDRDRLILFSPAGNDYYGHFFQSPSEEQWKGKDVLSLRVQQILSSSKMNSYFQKLFLHAEIKNSRDLGVGALISHFDPKNADDIGRFASSTQNYSISWYSTYHQQLVYSYVAAVCGRLLRQKNLPDAYQLVIVPGVCGGKYTQIYLSSIFWDALAVNFVPSCPECRLSEKMQGYFELVVPDKFLHQSLTMQVGVQI